MKLARHRLWIAAAGVLAIGATGIVAAATARAATGCQVSYTVTNQWQSGFGATVTVHNLGDPITGWNFAWTFAAGQTVTQVWSGTVSQSGADVTVTNASWNAGIPTGGSVAFGFNGTWTSANPVPVGFALNGITCTGAVATGSSAPPASSPPATSPPATSPPASSPPPSTGPGGDHWVASWTAMPQLTESANLPPAPYTQGNQVMVDATLRQTVHVSIGGSRFRLHLNNVFGGAALPITAASVASPTGGMAGVSGIVAGSATAVMFGGQPSVTIPVGKEAVSDPLDVTVASGANLTVTLYLAQGQASSSITSHPGSRTTSYLVQGNHLTDATWSNTTSVEHWYFLSGLDVWAPQSAAAVVMLGDSLTDGRGSTTNGNNRWPDDLFTRLQEQSTTANVAIANEAAGGNAVLSGGLGPTAVSRFDRDVLGQSGVHWLIVFEGVNDLGGTGSPTTANNLTAAYQQFITKAHAAGIKVFGATITPFGGNGYDDGAGTHEAARQTVNSWIRTSKQFDAVVDFDQAVRDPADPRRIRTDYDSGDHLHLNPTGYVALANAIPASLFTL